MQNIRSHNGIPRRPALARAATQRYIGSQKTRSKDRCVCGPNESVVARDTVVPADDLSHGKHIFCLWKKTDILISICR